MSQIIQTLQIQNFKSIRNLSLNCERINLFIGKPNAGKSNILEAVSLLGAGYSKGKFMEGLIRYKSLFHLFNNYDTRNTISLLTDSMSAELRKINEDSFQFSIQPIYVKENAKSYSGSYEPFESFKDMYVSTYGEMDYDNPNDYDPLTPLIAQTRDLSIQPEGKVSYQKIFGHNRSPVKKYEFQQQSGRKESHSFLTPPHGGNFYQIARSHQELREEIKDFLQPNGLELLLDEETKRVFVVQREAASLISFPLHLVPDTFQRYIFHLAAIFSNENSVILFEEPETHSYAPYVDQLAQHILQDERNNQYFITTHNPYFLLPILQEERNLAVFVTWFEDYQTHCRRLSEEEIREALNYGMGIFLNLDSLVPA